MMSCLLGHFPLAMVLLLLLLPHALCVRGGCFMEETPVKSASLPVCKEWENKEACCDAQSLELLKPTLAGLAFHFDRCMSCYDNWRRVLCTAACSTKQSTFIANSSTIDPRLTLWGEERRFQPLRFTMRMHPDLCDKLWFSCESEDTTAFSTDGNKRTTIHYAFNDPTNINQMLMTNADLTAHGNAIEGTFSSFTNFTSGVVNLGGGVVNTASSFVEALKRGNDTALKRSRRRLFCEVMSAAEAPGLGLSLALRTTDPVVRRSARPVLDLCPAATTTAVGTSVNCSNVTMVGTSGAAVVGLVCRGKKNHYALPASEQVLENMPRTFEDEERGIVAIGCAGRAQVVDAGGAPGASLVCRNMSQGLSPLAANATHMYGDSSSGVCRTAYFDCSQCYTRQPPMEVQLSPTRVFNLDIVVPPDLDASVAPCASGACLTEADVAASDKDWNGYEFCYLKHNNQVYLSRSAGDTMEFVLLLILGAIVANMVSQSSVQWFPPCMAYVTMGAILGALALNAGMTSPDDLKFDSQFFTFFLLPPIIFAEGFTLNISQFTSNALTIFVYAVPGTLIATLLVANALHATSESIGSMWDFPIISHNEALAFAALISATDPVATCDTFNELKVDHKLEILVIGESLVNDAAAIVLYKTFKEWVLYEGGQNSVTPLEAVADFSKFLALSMLIGATVAVVCSLICKHFSFHGNTGLETTVFVLMAYSTFLLAEYVHVSGILSSLVGGIVMSYYAQRNLSDYSPAHIRHTAAESLLRMLAALSNMMIFLLVGMALVVCIDSFSLLFTLLVIVFTLLGRACAIFPLTFIVNKFRSNPVPPSSAFLLWWSGLRGAVALALAVDMPSKHRFMMVSTTCVMITVTVLVYGGSTACLLRKFKVRLGVPDDDHGDSEELEGRPGFRLRTKAWQVWNNRVLVPLLTNSKPDIVDAEARANQAQDELALTQKALADKTKELSEYARKKDRQIEKIVRAHSDNKRRKGCAIRFPCLNARCLLIAFNALLLIVALAALVLFSAIVTQSKFATDGVREACHVFIAASATVAVAAVLGLVGSCRQSRIWLVPYACLVILTVVLEGIALAHVYEVEGLLSLARKHEFDTSLYERREQNFMRHVSAIANVSFNAAGCKAARMGDGTEFSFVCTDSWTQTFVTDRCTETPSTSRFTGCEATYRTSLFANTDIFCACRAATIDFIESNSRGMLGVGIGALVVELLALACACSMICCPLSSDRDEEDDEFDGAVYDDKKVVQLTKALADAKEAARKKLRAKMEREQAKEAQKVAKEAKRQKSKEGGAVSNSSSSEVGRKKSGSNSKKVVL